MSSDIIVLTWLNDDLQLSPKITNIRHEFSNGYRFGDVLYHLNAINETQQKQLKNSKKYEDQIENFKKIKKYLKEIYELEIRFEEFKEIMNLNVSKAVVVLYKIKNSYYKKLIHFSTINVFLEKPTQEQIKKKLKDIMDNEQIEEKLNDPFKLTKSKKRLLTQCDTQFQKSYQDSKKELNSIKSDSNDSYEDDIINEDELIKTQTQSNNSKNIHHDSGKNNAIKIINDENNDNKKSGKNLNTFTNDVNNENNIENNKSKKLLELPMLTKNNININKIRKKYLKPIPSNSNMNNNISNINNVNITVSNCLNNTNKFITPYDTKYNNLQKSVISEPSIDFYNDFGMTKIKEDLKKRLDKKRNEIIKKQEELKKQLRIKNNVIEIKEIHQLDFVNRIHNPLYKTKTNTNFTFALVDQNKTKSANKRLDFSKNYQKACEINKINETRNYFRSIVEKNTDLINKNLTKRRNLYSMDFCNILSPKKNNFNKLKYFKHLNKLTYTKFNEYVKERKKVLMTDFPLIKNMLYLIIDISMDMYFYREENDVELLDLPEFKKFSLLFINNKTSKIVEEEKNAQLLAEDIDTNENDNKKIDFDNIELTNDDIYIIEDYINYIGIWNEDKIMNKDLLGYKYEYRNINKDLPPDYEPTKTEIEDLILPKKNTDNFLYGNTILDIIESKFAENKKYPQEKNENINKWGYIPYKLAIIGYPFSGRKFISDNLFKKYPNIKIYSIKKIVRDYYIEYRNILDAIEGKNQNNLKPNQLEQLKTENKKKLEEFKPILDLIQPYIDIINKEREKKMQIKIQENKENELKQAKLNEKRKNAKKPTLSKSKHLKSEKSNNEIVFTINDDLKILPSDEVLFSVLKYKIESDFPIKSKTDSEKEIIDYQTKIYNIVSQLETIKKQKQENTKQNPKNDTQILNLEKELENLKTESINGFILDDYPSNINQCNLLENYLTGYVDETQKPKSEKNILISKINTLIDFKLKPKENVIIKKAGIDFIINLICQEKDVNERFKTKKYDPINDIIYTSSDLSDENKNKTPIDKKVLERLVNDIPYLTDEIFQKSKEEYNENISLINKLYNKFGILVNNVNVDEERNLLGIDFNEKETKKCFQSIIMANAEEILLDKKKKEMENNINNVNNVKEEESTNRKAKKKTEKKTLPVKNSNKNIGVSEFEIEEFNKNKILNFISQDIIGILYNENDKNEKIIFYSKHPEYNVNEENDRIEFAPEFENNNNNEIIKKNNNYSTMPVNDMRLSSMNNDNNNNILNDLMTFNEKYYKGLAKFFHLIKDQKNNIYQRLTLIQLKFREFLNQKTNKKAIINIYTTKYNEFFSENKAFFYSSKANYEFEKDLEELTENLWLLITEKEKMSIKELDANKNSGFIEKELEKFYYNVQNLFLLETEKFLTIFDSIICLYNKKDVKFNHYKKENILENLYDINYENIKNETKNNFKFRTTHKLNETDTSMNDSHSNFILDNIILKINKNIDILFVNSIKLILQNQEAVDNIIKNIRDSINIVHKKSVKIRRKKNANNLNESSSSLLSSFMNPKEASSCLQEEIFSKMIQNQKGKYKYRLMFLKSYANKYIKIIYQTAMNIYNNMDNWIVKNVSLQNDSLNNVINVIKNCLENKILIDKKNDIDPIEMDDFEKSGNGENILKPIDNNSVVTGALRIYNKMNIDYLINEKFNSINIDDLKNKYNNVEVSPLKKVNIVNIKTNEKKLKLAESNNELLERSLNSSVNNSSPNIFDKKKYKESDFYYDINKFNDIYKYVKKYEIEENIISQDALYNIFIKQYLINKYEDVEKDIKPTVIENIQKKSSSIKNKNKKVASSKTNLVSLNEDKNNINMISPINKILSNDNQNISTSLPEIPIILKNLNTKQINKLLYLCQINNNENDNNDNKIEYEKYLNTNEIFTILSLIGCQVLSKEEEEKIMSELKEKLKNGRLLSKKDFMEFEFWFEQELVYQKEDVIYQQIMDENKNEEENKNNKMNIKEFLFSLWKDDNGENLNFKQFLSVLKISKYITDLNEFEEEKYYDIIFNINNK